MIVFGLFGFVFSLGTPQPVLNATTSFVYLLEISLSHSSIENSYPINRFVKTSFHCIMWLDNIFILT